MDSYFLFMVVAKVLLALALWSALQYAALGPANRRRAQPLANARLFTRALLGVGAGVLAGVAAIALVWGTVASIGGELDDAAFFVILLSLPVGAVAAIVCGFRLARRWVLRAQPGAAPAPAESGPDSREAGEG
ncbi:hypothetical protein GLE_2977 [Lysobacter enzymogenes]|uniref:Uncharacterized protein n=1 Tax=Lysobacter enzymogenes TaxID=69 RepID=A0A0S2DI87_LYSEN|nr:hypothetical protein [Lysobacter enzymogenes]ALN58325.1 hypothetical protein GLE_2977 [Lysobacter enzymogenes]QCW26740.1 hypothetical protein FE772_14890 [Lysobacter enzymogenes]